MKKVVDKCRGSVYNELNKREKQTEVQKIKKPDEKYRKEVPSEAVKAFHLADAEQIPDLQDR